MQDKNMVINELKKLILVTKGKSVETQFDKPSVVRQPNAQRITKPSVLGKPTPFSNSPEMMLSASKLPLSFWAEARCVMVGYSTQSKGYRVYNKRTRLIAESIHIKFDEIKEMMFEHSSSSLGHQCQMMSDHNSSDLAPQRQEMSVENVSSGLVPQGQMASDHVSSDP
ncbi:hypothetical protein Tco_0187312, partial [Tanacetum coccineum]